MYLHVISLVGAGGAATSIVTNGSMALAGRLLTTGARVPLPPAPS